MKTSQPIPILSLNCAGAAKATSLSASAIRRLVAANEIPHARIGGRVTFPVRELTQWLSAHAAEQRGDRRLRRPPT